MSSELRLKTLIEPSSRKWTWEQDVSEGFAELARTADLGSLSIVLVLASELLALEAIENLRDGLCRLGEHGLERYAWERIVSARRTSNGEEDGPGVRKHDSLSL